MSPGEAGVVSAGYATDEFSFEIKTCPKPVAISVKLTVEQEPSLVCFPEGLYLLVKWDLGIYSGGFYLYCAHSGVFTAWFVESVSS